MMETATPYMGSALLAIGLLASGFSFAIEAACGVMRRTASNGRLKERNKREL
jgi:hypothetical protein